MMGENMEQHNHVSIVKSIIALCLDFGFGICRFYYFFCICICICFLLFSLEDLIVK